MKTKIILALLTLSMIFTSCDNGDDLNDIFLNHSWTLSFIKEGKKVAAPAFNTEYTMTFYETTFVLTTRNGSTIEGEWIADRIERTLKIRELGYSLGKIGEDEIAIKAITMLRNIRYYEGDSNWLQIQVDKNNYIQFHNK